MPQSFVIRRMDGQAKMFDDLEDDFSPCDLMHPNQEFLVRVGQQDPKGPWLVGIRGALMDKKTGKTSAQECVAVFSAAQIQMLASALTGWFGDLTEHSVMYQGTNEPGLN